MRITSKALAANLQDFPFAVRNFTYNGFCGKLLEGVADYRSRFLSWTGDPGVAVMECDDGKTRRIPTFALEGDFSLLPLDETKEEDKIIFGLSCTSKSDEGE